MFCSIKNLLAKIKDCKVKGNEANKKKFAAKILPKFL
jgi:hypothetical protein